MPKDIDSNSDKDEGFVSRWSRRKQQVAEEKSEQVDEGLNATNHNTATHITGGSGATSNIGDNRNTEEIISPEVIKAEKLEALNKLTDEDMPDIETLHEGSDFSAFMSTGVSEGLRSMALKKLFMGKSFNIRDGLDDYDDDYTVFKKMPSTMVTSDMKHMVGVEAKRKLAKEQEEERQRKMASGELEEGFDDIEEFDEFADDDVIAETEEYVDEHINVAGFDTTDTHDIADSSVIAEAGDASFDTRIDVNQDASHDKIDDKNI